MSDVTLELNVNGSVKRVSGPSGRTLLEVLREDLELGGVREGCGLGICGSCTVLVDGKAMSGCLMLAEQAEGHEVTTLEGVGVDGGLHPVQQAFLDHKAFQCAYCTPGFVLATIALLKEDPSPSDDRIREWLSANLCRCGTYPNILAAVRSLAGR